MTIFSNISPLAKVCAVFFLLCALVLASPFSTHAAKRTSILYLHSYHKATWSDEVMRGYNSILRSRPDTDFFVEYMDTKKIATDEYLQALFTVYQLKYTGTIFDVILVSDDNALRFALKYQHELFYGAPIVFCGINSFHQSMLMDNPNVTGVLEIADFEDTLTYAFHAFPETKKLFAISDTTRTGTINMKELQQVMQEKHPGITLHVLQDVTKDTLTKSLAELPANALVFLISFWKDATGTTIQPKALGKLLKNSSTPVLTRSEWMIGHGVLGGKCVRGFNQGQAAARLALQIIEGRSASTLAVQEKSPNQFMFDYNELERFSISLDSLPQNSLVLNQPLSFYERFKLPKWAVNGTFVLLFLLAVCLLVGFIQRRRAQQKLAHLNRYLEDVVEERTKELVDKTRELQAANKMLLELDELKSAFLSTVSHDIRTPLTSVLGFAKLTTKDFNTFFRIYAENKQQDLPRHASTGSKEQKVLIKKGDRIAQNLDIIRMEGKRLASLLDNFLDLSRLEAGRVTWDDTDQDMEKLIDKSMTVLQGFYAQKPDICLKKKLSQPLPTVRGDETRLLQVLTNLLYNAAKFTEKGHVIVHATTTGNGHVRVCVEDTGVGISEENLERVFDKFYQVDRDTLDHSPKGTGMGLPICSQIIEHYNGRIWAESTPNKGSMFIFELPVAD